MRINKWIAGQTGFGRRTVDRYIEEGKITVNGEVATMGQSVDGTEAITLNGRTIDTHQAESVTILLHKPRGYVCSREGQGSKTVYDLLPEKYRDFKLAGRLDKDSSGLLILSNDGDVIQRLSHPTLHKQKTYIITTRRPLSEAYLKAIQKGVDIGDERPSSFEITPYKDQERRYKAVLLEGRNRQIRRTMEAVGNQVVTLHRTSMGNYFLDHLHEGSYKTV